MNELDYLLKTRDAEYCERISALERAADADPADAKNLGFVPGFIELVQATGVDKVKTIAADVHANGYAIVPDLLTAAQVVRVRDALAPIFAECARMYEATGPVAKRPFTCRTYSRRVGPRTKSPPLPCCAPWWPQCSARTSS